MIRQVNSVPSHSVTQVYSSFFPLNLSPHVTITSDQIQISFTFQSSFPHNLFGKTLRYLSLSLSLSLSRQILSQHLVIPIKGSIHFIQQKFLLYLFSPTYLRFPRSHFNSNLRSLCNLVFFFLFFFFFNYKNQFNHTNSRFCRLNHRFPIFLAFSLMFIF